MSLGFLLVLEMCSNKRVERCNSLVRGKIYKGENLWRASSLKIKKKVNVVEICENLGLGKVYGHPVLICNLLECTI